MQSCKDIHSSISQVNTDPDRPQSTSDYGRMKRNVANSLRMVDTLNIATIFNFHPASIGELKSESAPGFLLLMILEQQGILEESNVDQLEEVLREVNLEMAVRHVHRYKESLPIPRLPRHRSESSLASEDRPQSLSEYGRMKRNVANSLTVVDTLHIATIFNFPSPYIDELPSKTVPSISLLSILEQLTILGESKVDKLEEALHEEKLEMAVQHVLRYKESLPIPESSLASEGVLGIVQKTHKDLQKILTDVSGDRLNKSQANKSLQESNETLTFAVQSYQCRPDNPPSSGTVTDDSRGHETTDDAFNERVERPRFKEISGIIQPHDVITFKNQIFILMDGGICAYNMAGKQIRRYQEYGFKPFAATFLDASLFVTDKKSKCVIKFDESLIVKKRFGKSNMTEPAGITSCERGKCIYVLTGRKSESAEVAKFTSDGEYLRCYCTDSLEEPWYIKKSSSDEFFISDFARKAVDIYTSDFSNRLYTVNTCKHCRGMDIDDEGNIYIALRDPGYKAQYECFVCYSRPTNGWVTIKESPKPWFWLNQNKSLHFVRGLHYYRCQDNKFLMFADPGNKRLKVISL